MVSQTLFARAEVPYTSHSPYVLVCEGQEYLWRSEDDGSILRVGVHPSPGDADAALFRSHPDAEITRLVD